MLESSLAPPRPAPAASRPQGQLAGARTAVGAPRCRCAGVSSARRSARPPLPPPSLRSPHTPSPSHRLPSSPLPPLLPSSLLLPRLHRSFSQLRFSVVLSAGTTPESVRAWSRPGKGHSTAPSLLPQVSPSCLPVRPDPSPCNRERPRVIRS